MSTNTLEKYKQSRKRRQKQDEISLQYLAQQYELLRQQEYNFVLTGNIEISFMFRKENFYHLLGFHYIKDVTCVKLVRDNRLKKEDFYDYILNGEITYSTTNIKQIDKEEEITNFDCTSYKSEMGEIINNRFNFFSAINVRELLNTSVIIDFDVSKSDSIIEADKIFFKCKKDQRHLNLFIGYDNKKIAYYVQTFFLEKQPKKFIINSETGEKQQQLNILSKSYINTTNNKVEQFKIIWTNVRREIEQRKGIVLQGRIKNYFAENSYITSIRLYDEIQKLTNLYNEVCNKYKEVEYKKKKYELVRNYYKNEHNQEERDSIQLSLMDFNVDIENSLEIKDILEWEISSIKNEYANLKDKINSYKNKLNRYQEAYTNICKYEKDEVKLAYRVYLSEVDVWDEEFINLLINTYKCFDNSIQPKDIATYYDLYQKGNRQ